MVFLFHLKLCKDCISTCIIKQRQKQIFSVGGGGNGIKGINRNFAQAPYCLPTNTLLKLLLWMLLSKAALLGRGRRGLLIVAEIYVCSPSVPLHHTHLSCAEERRRILFPHQF